MVVPWVSNMLLTRNLLYTGIKHPSANGVCEVIHQDIVNSLLARF